MEDSEAKYDKSASVVGIVVQVAGSEFTLGLDEARNLKQALCDLLDGSGLKAEYHNDGPHSRSKEWPENYPHRVFSSTSRTDWPSDGNDGCCSGRNDNGGSR